MLISTYILRQKSILQLKKTHQNKKFNSQGRHSDYKTYTHFIALKI